MTDEQAKALFVKLDRIERGLAALLPSLAPALIEIPARLEAINQTLCRIAHCVEKEKAGAPIAPKAPR